MAPLFFILARFRVCCVEQIGFSRSEPICPAPLGAVHPACDYTDIAERFDPKSM